MKDMPLIFSYTRAQAIADGVLVDVTARAKEAGFKVPVALTSAVYERCVEWNHTDEREKPGLGQSKEGRLWDVLVMAFLAAKRTDGDRAPFFVLYIERGGSSHVPATADLVLTIHPGDEGEPVCTVMEPGED